MTSTASVTSFGSDLLFRRVVLLITVIILQMIFLSPFTAAVIAESNRNTDFQTEYRSLTSKCKVYNRTTCLRDGIDCGGEQLCPFQDRAEHTRCYVLWTNSSDGKIEVEIKGCILGDESCHDHRKCIARHLRHEVNERRPHIYCCCQTDNCNEEFSWDPPDVPIPLADTKYNRVIVMVLSIFGSLMVLSVIIVVAFYFYRRSKLQPYFHPLPGNVCAGTNDCTVSGSLTASNSIIDSQSQQTAMSNYSTNNSTPISGDNSKQEIKLLELKATGRFGAIWKAEFLSNRKIVAVKIFPASDFNSWDVEKEVYALPQFRHRNILEFFGVQRKGMEMRTEFWLLSAFHERGSLSDYLRSHPVSFRDTCRIAQDIAKGLCFLHEEIPSTANEAAKPVIAHRDFKSKNVLLKLDLTACIADFGLAIVFYPGQSPGDTHGQVGTRRYMAPEVLEGAISFQPDAFLRIDMYACGLVLWELVSRTFTPDLSAHEYRLPFEEEVGYHPSLEDMQECVVMNKCRPYILSEWKQHPGVEVIVSTMEECWDHDSEARLTAACVVERLSVHNIQAACDLYASKNKSIHNERQLSNSRVTKSHNYYNSSSQTQLLHNQRFNNLRHQLHQNSMMPSHFLMQNSNMKMPPNNISPGLQVTIPSALLRQNSSLNGCVGFLPQSSSSNTSSQYTNNSAGSSNSTGSISSGGSSNCSSNFTPKDALNTKLPHNITRNNGSEKLSVVLPSVTVPVNFKTSSNTQPPHNLFLNTSSSSNSSSKQNLLGENSNNSMHSTTSKYPSTPHSNEESCSGGETSSKFSK